MVLLFVLSLVENSIARLSQVSLKVLADKEEGEQIKLLDNLARDRSHYLLPLQFGMQFAQITLAVLVTTLVLSSQVPYGALGALLLMLALIALVRQLIPRMLTQSDPQMVLLKLLPFFSRCYQLLQWLSSPLSAVLRLARSSRAETAALLEEEEAREEEIQAYIGIGEQEGIIEKGESKLIQSALRFGDRLVDEIMTPRMEIAAIDEKATVAELKRLMVSSKHSRILVYRQNIDQVAGVVYLRSLLAYLEEGKEEDSIAPLLNEAMFVPDTKGVLELLTEMQASAEHLAIVVNEYGAVSGLVTIEDLVEELVGEIRDEDEQQTRDLVAEEGGSYVVGGRVGIHQLEDVLDVRLGDPHVATVSGLVVSYLGRVPAAGERVLLNGMEIEIVSSDRRRIHSIRVRKSHPRSHRPGGTKTA